MADTNEMLSAMEFMQDNMALVKRQVELNAVLTKVAYESLMRVGFSEEQALSLIESRGAML